MAKFRTALAGVMVAVLAVLALSASSDASSSQGKGRPDPHGHNYGHSHRHDNGGGWGQGGQGNGNGGGQGGQGGWGQGGQGGGSTTTTPANVPYSLPVTTPADKTSPTVSAQAPYTPAVLNLIAQLEGTGTPTLAQLTNATILLHRRNQLHLQQRRTGRRSDRYRPVDHADLLDRRPGRQHVLRPECRDDDGTDDVDEPSRRRSTRTWPTHGVRPRALRRAS